MEAFWANIIFANVAVHILNRFPCSSQKMEWTGTIGVIAVCVWLTFAVFYWGPKALT